MCHYIMRLTFSPPAALHDGPSGLVCHAFEQFTEEFTLTREACGLVWKGVDGRWHLKQQYKLLLCAEGNTVRTASHLTSSVVAGS